MGFVLMFLGSFVAGSGAYDIMTGNSSGIGIFVAGVALVIVGAN